MGDSPVLRPQMVVDKVADLPHGPGSIYHLNPMKQEQLKSTLDYVFNDTDLLIEALQGPGSDIRRLKGRDIPDGNKRLAVVGRAVLKLVLVMDWYPGTMNRIPLVNDLIAIAACTENLHRVGLDFDLELFMNPWKNDHKPEIIQRLVEAIIGAVFLDGGIDAAHRAICTLDVVDHEAMGVEYGSLNRVPVKGGCVRLAGVIGGRLRSA